MDGKRRWLAWIAIGVSGLAVLVVLLGGRFGPGAMGRNGVNAPQAYAQQGPAQQGTSDPRAQRQDGRGQQGTSDQHAQRQQGPTQGGPGGDARRGGEQRGERGFGLGGWLRLPLRLIVGSFQATMVALLVLAGLWFLRSRAPAAAAQGGAAAPQSPTGETYSE